MNIKPKCGNCDAGRPIAGNPQQVWCCGNYPTVLVTFSQAQPPLVGLPGNNGPQKNYESAFPPMSKEHGWCRQWGPDEKTRKLLGGEAKVEAQRILDEIEEARERGV